MFTNNEWIYNQFKKIKNPIKYPGVNQIYQGILPQDFDFKHQEQNFIKIKNSLEQFQIMPTEIYYGLRANKTIFVVCFSDPNIFWHKYEGEKYGSGQNYIYWKDRKFATTQWIKFTPDEILQIFNG